MNNSHAIQKIFEGTKTITEMTHRYNLIHLTLTSQQIQKIIQGG